jgi:rod shape determining protein RodA
LDVKRLKFIDKSFVFLLLLLLSTGLIILTSATRGVSSDPYYYLEKQLGAIVIGIILAILVIRFEYSQLKRFSPYLYGFSLLLLIMVLVFGQEVRGTTGWISLGPLPPMQPAELTKILLILAFASVLDKRKGKLEKLSEMMPCFIFMGIPFVLIMLQPDLGTALVYIFITVIMMFTAGANPKVLWKLIIAALILIGALLFMHFQFGLPLPLDDYQLKRLIVFIDPYQDGQGGRGAGWNTIQSLVAIGSGGLTGKGLFNGTQVQLNFLPEHHTDFIYAVIGEEFGFLGGTFVILLYGGLLLRAIYISHHSRDLYGTLLVVGITAMWLFHIYENIGMSIGLMPITGIPLPFLSYGGSSMVTNLLAAALILSVNVRGRKLVF